METGAFGFIRTVVVSHHNQVVLFLVLLSCVNHLPEALSRREAFIRGCSWKGGPVDWQILLCVHPVPFNRLGEVSRTPILFDLGICSDVRRPKALALLFRESPSLGPVPMSRKDTQGETCMLVPTLQ